MSAGGLCVTLAGVDVAHDKDFSIDRPSGSGDYLFLCFTTPVHLRARDGVQVRRPGACILYPPGATQWYSGVTAPFRHHWLHAHGSGLRPLLRACRIPLNEVFYLPNAGAVAAETARIRGEIADRRPGWEEVSALLLELLIRILARHLYEPEWAPRRAESNERMRAVRRQVHETLGERWDIARMARLACLSPTRFSVVYKQTFGVSPIEDLLGVRLQRGCWLLTNTRLTVKEAARQCGFESLSYFSRQFHRRIGCAPRAYYRTHVVEGASGRRIRRFPKPFQLKSP